MLRQLTIRDYAIVAALDVELAPGLTVVTGETGAGKSILLDALGLALGDRTSSANVRTDAGRAEVAVAFDLPEDAPAQRWLAQRELDDHDDPRCCVLRRTISADGRSRAYINGRPANAQDLAQLANGLLDMHTQHAHQSLLRPATQLDYLDAYGKYPKDLVKVAQAWSSWQTAEQRLRALTATGGERGQDLEYLRFQLDELVDVALSGTDYAALSDRHRRLSASDQNRDTLAAASSKLSEIDNNALDQVRKIEALLDGLEGLDVGLLATIREARINLEEAARELGRAADSAASDPEQLAEIDRQLGEIHNLARKHRVRPEELGEEQARLQTAWDDRQAELSELPLLEAEVASSSAAFHRAAEALSKKRRRAAGRFKKEITATLKKLGMPHSVFDVGFTEQAAAHGLERPSFLVAANPGAEPRPIGEVASGGELSRISLAIQVIAAATSHIPTLVLDEADAGVGGATADIIGQTLRRLAEHTQILCVTHSPQVAAQGHHHWRVTKGPVANGQAATSGANSTVEQLDAKERVEELARMIGGSKVTAKARARAEEMLEHSA